MLSTVLLPLHLRWDVDHRSGTTLVSARNAALSAEVPPQAVNFRTCDFFSTPYLLAEELDSMGDSAFAFSGRRGTLPLSDFIGM